MTTAAALAARVRAGGARVDAALEAALAAAAHDATTHRAFTARHGTPRRAVAAAGRADRAAGARRRAARGRDGGLLAGVPVAVGDDLADVALPTTAGSHVLAGYVSPYEATVVARLHDAGAVLIGKTNLDEFNVGWSTETSAYGPTGNPAAPGRTPGGAAGGAAAAVAAGLVPLAFANDAGGGLRLAAAGCGVVGVRPTYGRVSRAGLVACAPSLDQVGVVARTVDDAALGLAAVGGRDPRDATSADVAVGDLRPALTGGAQPLLGVRVARVREHADRADPRVRQRIDAVAERASRLGATVTDVSVAHADLALPAFHAIAAAECASSVARYDGVRYGPRAVAPGPRAVYAVPRGAGFGPAVLRHALLGTYLTSADDPDAHFRRAQHARARVARALTAALAEADVLLAPTAPGPALALGADAAAGRAHAAFAVGAALAGLPALSFPAGDVEGAPVGAQLVGRHFGEALLLRVAAALVEPPVLPPG